MKKKLLYLSQCFPYPPDGGGTIKSFNTIKSLSKRFDVYAIFVSERSGTKSQKEVFRKMGVKVKVFKTYTMIESIKNNYWRLLFNYLQLRPHFVYQYRYIPAIKYIRKVIKLWQPEVIHVDHVNSSQFLPNLIWLKFNLKSPPVLILENHNLNHIIFKTRFLETRKFIRKVYLFLEGSLNYLYGVINYGRYDHIFSISDSETKYLKKYYKSVSTQPLVYPFPTPVKNKKSIEKNNILFIGNLSWPPNEVAVQWFIESIFPLVKLSVPGAVFHIVGKYNKKFNRYNKNPDLVFWGYQNNIAKFLRKANVFVLPFKTGGGVRIKSLTALQYGIPIVSTKLGADGLKLRNQKDILLADSDSIFADAIIKLLKNENLASHLSKNSQRYFNDNHSSKKNTLFLNEYHKIIMDKQLS